MVMICALTVYEIPISVLFTFVPVSPDMVFGRPEERLLRIFYFQDDNFQCEGLKYKNKLLRFLLRVNGYKPRTTVVPSGRRRSPSKYID
jgi:hypothetical protein